MSEDRALGESEWVYESIVRSVPGIKTSRSVALAAQLLGFEAAILVLALWYDLPGAAVAGSVAVFVSVAGSAFMLGLSRVIRREDSPPAYRSLLFGSHIEIVLGLMAFFALVVYVFVYDPRQGGNSLLTTVLGDRPPVVFVFLLLVVSWDVMYRIGVGWWASLVGLWRTYRYGDGLSPESRTRLRRLDAATIGFAAFQLLFLPLLVGHPILQFAVVGHAAAVTVVSGLSILFLRE
ncbi:DUF7530 family protein [Halovenus salina]|uniref:Uncharacterized protein n=1 Tax=Halovenus salina TaxID=1510225 RepID=A0ABD5W3P9_9EURY|nr:hypothetical protein [Halovenus salina]